MTAPRAASITGAMLLQWSTFMLVALLSGLPGPSSPPTVPDHSESIGHPFSGHLRNGVQLPHKARNYQLRWKTAANRWSYGVGDLIEGLRWAAERMAETGGAPLVIGNLSRKRGGDLPCSRSHNSGRDVDLGLYMLDSRGRSLPSRYYRFGKDGRSLEAGGRYRFDVARNWALVRTLLAAPHFDVQWLVINPHLERLLLKHARAIGEPPALVRRAASVLDLPGYANLHRNHLHVRINCPPDHTRCEEGGPIWPWTRHRVATN